MSAAQLRGIVDKANKKFGIGTVVYGRELRQQVIERTTSGSLALDEALGGGWPLNQWNEIVGDESSGKTVVALQTIAANQRASKRWTAVWVAAEWLPPEWAEANGVDLDRMLVINTNLMEEVFDLVTEFVESREIDCLVVDSLPALIPETEDDQQMADFAVGVGARLTGKFFRKQYKATKRSITEKDRPILVIMINQWREKIGVMHGDPRTTPGGKGKNFAYFTRTECRRTDWLTDDNKVRIGQKITARVFKNKTAPGQRNADFDFYFAEGGPVEVGQYDTLTEILDLAVARGAVLRRGRSYYVDGERIATSAAEWEAAVRNDDELAAMLSKRVLNGIVEDPSEEAPAPRRVKKVAKKAVKRAKR